MATVATNDKLHDRIQLTTRAYLTQEKTRLERQFLRNLPDDGYVIYEKLVGKEHVAWTSRAPDEMFDMANKLAIRNLGTYEVALDLPMSRKVPIPSNATRFVGGTLESSYKCISAKLDPTYFEWEPYLEAAEALSTKRAKLIQDIRALDQFTLRLIRLHKSLGPVLRTWPPLWDLLASEDRTKQGAKPYGAALEVPTHVATEEKVKEFTAMVVRIKMATR